MLVPAMGIFPRTGALACTEPLFITIAVYVVILVLALVYSIVRKEEVHRVDTYLNVPLWRSLVLKHTWLLLLYPCHGDCAVIHATSPFCHVLCLMASSSILNSIAVSPSSSPSSSSFWIAVIIPLIISAPFVHFILSFYYYYWAWDEVDDDASTVRGPASMKPYLNHRSSIVRMNLTNRKASGIIHYEPEGEKEQSSIDVNGLQRPATAKEQGQPDILLTCLDNVVLLEEDFSVVHVGDMVAQSEELSDINPSNCQTSPFSAGDTLHRIALHEGAIADGAVEADTCERFPNHCESTDDNGQPSAEGLRGNTPQPPPPPALQGLRIVVQPYRAKGHLVSGIFALVMILAAFWTMNTFQTIQTCSTFYITFLYTMMMDIVLAQPLAVLLSVLYRWLTSGEEATLWSELHPVHNQLRSNRVGFR